MKIQFNGQSVETSEPATVAAVLQQMGVRSCYVAVELNRELVPRERHAETPLEDGDELEVVTLVGGG